MTYILIHRHPECRRCARIARAHRWFDWFHRIDHTTQPPRSGPLRMGEIVVEEVGTGRLLAGAEAVDLIYRQVPLYWPLRLLLCIPPLRAWVDRSVRGCADEHCQVGRDTAKPGVPTRA